MFQKTGGKYAKKLKDADGNTFTYGATKLRFSEPVSHGQDNSMLGYVIMASVEYGDERFMFAPDVQGPMSNHTLELIKTAQPTMLMLGGPPFYLGGPPFYLGGPPFYLGGPPFYLGGPPFYLGGFRVEESQLQNALNNLSNIVETVSLTILEHHALRDESWKQKVAPLCEHAATVGHKLMTAAEYVGIENVFLESRRKQLYRDFPPSKEFELWMKTLNSKKSLNRQYRSVFLGKKIVNNNIAHLYL
jgi:predicted metallo-beta-lactamase superfamily hydrolase